jgi:hypothetical protein
LAKPDQPAGGFSRDCPVVETNTRGPKASDLFEVQGWALGIVF